MAVTDLPDSISFPPTGGPVPARRSGGWPPPPGTLPIVIGVLALTSLLLGAALLTALSDAQASTPGAVDLEAAPTRAATEPDTPETVEPVTAPASDRPSVASFPADPSPIPVDLLTRLESAGDSSLETELGFLLDAIQHGFGRNSARLEPTLRSYVFRMTSRFV